jgi:hypothetical protein
MADELMFIQKSTMDAIATATKEKSGNSNAMFPKDIPNYIRSINTSSGYNNVPSDIVTEARRVANAMIPNISSNSVTFIAMSDMHELGDKDHSDASIIERYRRSNLNAGQGAKIISDLIPLDFFVNLGDFAWGDTSKTTTYDLISSITRARGYTSELENSVTSFFTPGNHDVKSVSGYLDPNVVTGLTSMYRYVDFSDKKVRVICLDTADTTDGTTSTERVSGEQLQWFADALDLSSKSDVNEWGIIVLSHHPLDWGVVKPLATCLSTYLSGSNYSTTHDGISISHNYTGKNGAKFIANFHGHTHCFKVADINGTTAKRVAIPNACHGRSNEYGSLGNTEFGETTTYNKTDNNTGKNTSFCLVSIDLDAEIIYAYCFGAGYDRIISYAQAEVITYSITNNLSNATNNNTETSIVEGFAYAASIMADSKYEIDSIKVVMDGVDITSSVVNGNIISIGSVTGDVVITVTTTYVGDGTYTNLVTTSLASDGVTVFNSPYGYQNGVYVSGTSSLADANCVATGAILLTDDVDAIYIKGAKWDTTNAHVRFYAGNINSLNSHTVKADGSGTHQLASYFDFEQLGTNYYKFTLTDNGKSVLVGRYYRLSLVGTGENLIVTHNEPIPDSAVEIKCYTISNTLSNVSNSNATNRVKEGEAYTATLTASDGYEISSVVVTMGSTDVTSSVYSNGVINISSVTGNIVVTATATAASTENYTNLVPTSVDYDGEGVFNDVGYKNNYYATTDAPYYKADTQGCCVTGIIPYDDKNPQTIYIKGVTFNTAKSHNRIGFFDTNRVCKTTPTVSQLASYFTITELGTNYYRLVPITGSPMTTWGYRGGINISAYGDGANMIVTLDEPIE